MNVSDYDFNAFNTGIDEIDEVLDFGAVPEDANTGLMMPQESTSVQMQIGRPETNIQQVAKPATNVMDTVIAYAKKNAGVILAVVVTGIVIYTIMHDKKRKRYNR
jgi:hypothetical protein